MESATSAHRFRSMPRRKVLLWSCLTLLFPLLAGWTAVAHHLTRQQVIALLNGAEVKRQGGIVEVAVDKSLDRLLVIRVGLRWYRLSEADRKRLASSWHSLWRNAVPHGSLAVVDSETHDPVVNFQSSGRITLLNRSKVVAD